MSLKVVFERQYFAGNHSFSAYAKIFQKTNISYPLIRTRTCAYQGVRNASFSDNFLYVLNERSFGKFTSKILMKNWQAPSKIDTTNTNFTTNNNISN